MACPGPESSLQSDIHLLPWGFVSIVTEPNRAALAVEERYSSEPGAPEPGPAAAPGAVYGAGADYADDYAIGPYPGGAVCSVQTCTL
jgi:hypothetical protein